MIEITNGIIKMRVLEEFLPGYLKIGWTRVEKVKKHGKNKASRNTKQK